MDTPTVIIRLLEDAGPLKITFACAGVCWSLLGVFPLLAALVGINLAMAGLLSSHC
jgi:hypothetical protein